jgi:ketosteroid isomerase-like protein
MRTLLLAAALCCVAAAADTADILALERKAMDGFLQGNPDPALSMAAPDITYFHTMTQKRLDGLPAVKALYEQYRGRPLFDSYEMADAKVQTAGDVAILTYILVQHVQGNTARWNATEVYRKTGDGWLVIHSHWSAVREQ